MAILNLLVSVDKVMTRFIQRKKKTWNEGVGGRKTHQSITVVNGNRGPGDVCNVTNKGAVCLEKLPVQYPLRPSGGLGLLETFAGIASGYRDISINLIVPLHHGARRHQPAVGPQAEVELLPKRGDIEEEFLVGLRGAEGLPLDALLVGGREQVGQVVSVGVGAEGGDQAVFLQPVPQPLCNTAPRNVNQMFSGRTTEVSFFSFKKHTNKV